MRTLTTAGLLAGLAIAPAAIAQTETQAQELQTQEMQTPSAPAEPEGGAATAPDATAMADYDAATVLATVNGTDITLGHAIVMRQRLPEQYQGLPDDVLLPGIVEQLVDQTLLAGSVSGAPGDDPLDVRLHLENERRGTLAARVVQQSVAGVSDEAAVQQAYEAATGAFEAQTEYNASHILVDSEEKAAEILAQIEADGDFAELAAEHSSDGSAQAGGSLGWFGAGQMVPQFEQAVQEMEVGAVAGPVETQFGWHLIRLVETRESAAPPLEQVRPEIENQLRQEKLQAELEALRAAATIDMPEAAPPATAISDTSLLEE